MSARHRAPLRCAWLHLHLWDCHNAPDCNGEHRCTRCMAVSA